MDKKPKDPLGILDTEKDPLGILEQPKEKSYGDYVRESVAGLAAFPKSVINTFFTQQPQEAKLENLRNASGSLEDYINPTRDNTFHASGFEFPEAQGLKNEYGIWINKQDDKTRQLPNKERAQLFLKERLGDDYGKLSSDFDQQLGSYRTGIETEIQQSKQKSQSQLEGVPQSYKDVNSLGTALGYAGNLGGQGAGRILSSLASGGSSSFIAERAATYDRQLDQLAQGVSEKTGMSPEEARLHIVKFQKDNPKAGEIIADFAGLLDFMSASALGEGKVVKNLVSPLLEGSTEAAQSELEEYGATKGSNVPYNYSVDRSIDSFLGGVLGAKVAGAIMPENKSQSIQKEIDNVADTGNPIINQSIDQISESNDTTNKEGLSSEKREGQESEQTEPIQETSSEETSPSGVFQAQEVDNTQSGIEQSPESQNIPEEAQPKEEQIKAAEDKINSVTDRIKNISPDEDISDLIAELNEAKQERDNLRIESEKVKKQKQQPLIIRDPARALKEQIQQHYKTLEEGIKKGQRMTNENLIPKVQEALKQSELTNAQVSSILNKVKKTNLFSPGSVSKLNDFITKAVDNAKYAEEINNAESLRTKIKKRSKTSSEVIPFTYKQAAKEFSKIDPSETTLPEYNKIAENIINGFRDPKNNKYEPIDLKKVNSFVSGNRPSNIFEGIGLNDQEAEDLINAEDTDEHLFNAEITKAKINRDRILRLAEYSKLGLESVDNERAKRLSDTDLNLLSDGQLLEYVRTADNIVLNDDYSNAGKLESQIEAVKGLKELQKLKGKTADIGKFKGAVYNVPMMFNAIYSDNKAASKVQLYSGLQDVYNGGSRVESQEHELYDRFQKEADRIKSKYKKSVLNAKTQVDTGVFAALVRHPKGENPTETLEQSKRIIKASIERLKRSKDKEEIGKDAEKSFVKFEKASSIDEVKSIMRSTNPEGYEMWDFFRKEFETNVKDKLKANSEEIFNRPFVEEENYTPKAFTTVDKSLIDQEQAGVLPSAFYSDLPSRPKQSKTALAVSNSLPSGRAINFEFYSTMFRKFRESIYDIETSKPRLVFREFMKLPDSEKVLGGLENKNEIKSNYDKSEEIQRGVGRDYSDAGKFLDEVTGSLRTLGYTAALGSVDQFVKQYVPVATNTMWNLGGDSGLFFSHIPEGTDKLFNLYTIGQRGRRLGGAERGESVSYKIQSQYRNRLLKMLGGFHKFSEKGSRFFMYSLTKGDVNVAQRSWVAYYLQYLKNNGVDISKVNLAEEHNLQNDKIRREAASYAEQKVKETQVVSNPSELGKLLRTSPGAESWVKNLFIPFSTFSINTKVRFIENLRQLRTNEDKAEAYRALAGTVNEIVLYSTIKFFVLSLAYNVLKGAIESGFGLDSGDREDDTDFKVKQWYSAIAKDFFPFAVGTYGENASMWALNQMAYLAEHPDMTYEEWKKENKGERFYQYKSPNGLDLGLYSIGAKRIQDVVNDTETTLTGNAAVSTTFGDKDIELTENQKKFMAFMTMMDFLSVNGYMDAGLFNTFKKIQREQYQAPQQPTRRFRRLN